MKIAFTSYYSGLQNRGMETVVSQLARKMAKTQKVLLIQSGRKIDNTDYQVKIIKSDNLLTIRDGGSLLSKLFLDKHSLAILIFSLKAIGELNKFRPEIIFICNGGWQSLIMKIYCVLKKVKCVVSGQAGIGWDDRWNLLLNPNLFITLSQRNLNWAKKIAPKVKKAIIFNGVDCTHFNSNGPKLDLNLPRPIILCVAGGEKYKRVRKTIEAISQIPKASLLLVRPQYVSDPDVEFAYKMLGERFACRQFDHQQMPAVYRSCDLFTLVSQSSEAFGVSYLEAMASNLPVVATNDELRQEIIGNAGILVDEPIAITQYSNAIQKALESDWADLPRQMALNYDWDIQVKKYLHEFNNLFK